MVIRAGSINAAAGHINRKLQGRNNTKDIMIRLGVNLAHMRQRLPDQTIGKTIGEMQSVGIVITDSWLSALEKGEAAEVPISKLVDICNFYDVTLHEVLFHDLPRKYNIKRF